MPNEVSFFISSRRKKKSPTSIVPPSFFDDVTVVTPVNISAEAPKNTKPQENPTRSTPTSTEKQNTESPKTEEAIEKVVVPNLHISKRKGSALSLKSIQQKKELLQNTTVKIEDPKNLPENPFTEEQLLQYWNEYGKRMDKKGERIIGSMVAMNKPTLKENHVILLELPNQTMKVDIENIEKPLLHFLHEKLSNYSITLQIHVNETVAKKHAFTPQEKYNKLKEQNPLIDLLRSKLDLDL